MELPGHATVTALAIPVIFLLGGAALIGTPPMQLVFFTTFALFSIMWNPDIDLVLKIFPGGHRGITHNTLGIIMIAGVIGLTGFAIKSMIHYQLIDAIIFPLALGASTAWALHALTDSIYDKLRQATWLLILIALVAIYLLIK